MEKIMSSLFEIKNPPKGGFFKSNYLTIEESNCSALLALQA